MSNPAYIAVDWGTSSFRLWMLDRHGDVLAERRSGEGMTVAAASGFGAILDGHLAAIAAPAGLPVLVCGMAGARSMPASPGRCRFPARRATCASCRASPSAAHKRPMSCAARKPSSWGR